MSTDVNLQQRVCLARQPILDDRARVFGYELLCQTDGVTDDGASSRDRNGASVLTDAVLTIGLATLTGGRPAFLNFTRALLLNHAGQLLPPSAMVVELQPDIGVDSGVIEACQDLQNRGYALGLDHFTAGSEAEELVPYAKFVKVDVLKTPGPDRAALAARLLPLGVRLIAEKVETAAMADAVRSVGYRLFQGYYFCEPTSFQTAPMPASKLTYLDLLGALNRRDATVEHLEELVKRDVSLSYRVLRSINSPAYGLRREVTSIRQALVLLGRDHIRNWASVWALAGLSNRGTSEAVSIALVRARCCELIAAALAGRAEDPGYFLLGLFSVIDVIVGRPMADVLESVPLPDNIAHALLGGANQARTVLDAAIAYERGEWDRVSTAVLGLGLDAGALPEIYADALLWAGELSRATESA